MAGKGGTFRFEIYVTMQIVSEERLHTVAVVRITEDMPKIEFVRKLLSESKKTGLKKKSIILMDREFSSVDVMRFLDEHGEKFLMAASKRLESRNRSWSFAMTKERQYQNIR